MSEASKSIPLSTEQRFVLSQLVEKGSLVKVGGQTFLMSPVSPMMEDFLKAIRLPEVPNNLAGVGESSPPAADDTDNAITLDERGVTVDEMLDRFIAERSGTVEGAVSAYVETTVIRLLMLVGCRKDESVTLH